MMWFSSAFSKATPERSAAAIAWPLALRGAVGAVTLAGCLGLATWGCEATPDRTDDATAEAVDDAERLETDDAEADPLHSAVEEFIQGVEAAGDAPPPQSRAANEPVLDIDWLTPGSGEPDAEIALEGDARSNVTRDLQPDSAPTHDASDDAADPDPGVGVAAEVDGPDPLDPALVDARIDAGAPAARPMTMPIAELLDALDERIARENREGLRPWLARAAMTLVDPERHLTDDDLGALPSDDRRLVLAYQSMFTHLGRSLDGEDEAQRREASLAAEQLSQRLRSDRHLTIAAALLCRRVEGYGVYDQFESTTFLAGREQPAIIYMELEDFATEQTSENRYAVRLQQEITLYNAADGLAVWRVKPTQIVDESRNQRRDFFVVQVVRFPRTLNVGRYDLKVTITDEVGHAVDEATIPIEFVAEQLGQR